MRAAPTVIRSILSLVDNPWQTQIDEHYTDRMGVFCRGSGEAGMVSSRIKSEAAGTRPFRVLNAAGSEIPAPAWLGQCNRPPADDLRGIALVLVERNEKLPVSLIDRLQKDATTLIVGPAKEPDWRQRARSAGAFACMSHLTPLEDRGELLFSATKHRSARIEIQSIRGEAEILCRELVESFASAMEKLGLARLENQRVLEALEGARMQILRTLS